MIHFMLLNQLHLLHAYYMLSLVAVAAAVIVASPHQRDQRARAVSSPLSVGFILSDNIPAHCYLCEVLAAYR